MRRLLLLLLITLTLAFQAEGAITHVSNDVSNAGNTSSLALTVSSTGAGHLLIVGVNWSSSSNTITVSGNGSGSFTASTVGAVCNSTSTCSELFYVQNATGGDTTVTITQSAASQTLGHFMEFAGAATTGGEDGTASGTGSGTAGVTTGNVSTAGTADVVIGFLGSANTSTQSYTAGTGFTLSTATVQHHGDLEYQIMTSAYNATVGLTQSNSANWAMVADAFKAPGGGGGGQKVFPFIAKASTNNGRRGNGEKVPANGT